MADKAKTKLISEYVTLTEVPEDEYICFGIEEQKEDDATFSEEILDYFNIEVISTLEEDD